ncbi:Ribosomal protein S7 [Spironucleus salmonicida]|uniref:40S ribosomal protein S7 n=1 Tax=Spironucleus salmonicida TaxID=348837 RepID=V6LX05_9EUKA|nr:Ribosomal protein S7 [Spironucleus salmonicida]|eukprot:EST48768.1 Ribosomal protein S7 [Spironucleus salmonicida]
MQYSSPIEKQTAFEKSVIAAFKKINDTKSINVSLSTLHTVRAEEIEVTGSKKAAVVFVPADEITLFHADPELINALEKQFQGCQMHIVAARATAGKRGNKDFHKSIKYVNECMEDDLCYPTIIQGRRTLFHAGKQSQKLVIAQDKKELFTMRANVCEQIIRKVTKRCVDIIYV